MANIPLSHLTKAEQRLSNASHLTISADMLLLDAVFSLESYKNPLTVLHPLHSTHVQVEGG